MPTPDLSQAVINTGVRAVEALGGARLTEKCTGRTLVYRKPKREKVSTCACGNDLKIALPYEVLPIAKDKDAVSRGGGLAILCLLCDFGIAAPRIVQKVYELEREDT